MGLAGKSFAELYWWETSMMSMFVPLQPGDILVSLTGLGQSTDELGCCSLVHKQIPRLSSSKTSCRLIKPEHWPAASGVGSMWTGCRTCWDFELPLKLTPILQSMFRCFSERGWPHSSFYSSWEFIAFSVVESFCLSRERQYPTAADTAVTKLHGVQVTQS